MKTFLLLTIILSSSLATAQITPEKILLKRYQKALEKLKKTVDSIGPNSYFYYYERGNIRLDYFDYVKSIADFDKALKLKPDDASIYYNRGIAKMEMNLLNEAIKDFDKVIELDPKKAFAYNNRSVCKYYMANYTGAIEDSSIAILLDPANAEAHNNRGISKIMIGMKEEGCEDLHKALELGDKESKHAIRKFCK